MYIISTKFRNKYFPTLYIKPNIFTYINKIRMIKYLLASFIINNEIIIILLLINLDCKKLNCLKVIY